MIAKIAVSAATFAIDKPYSYYVPEGMILRPGVRVMVPFGRGNRLTEGIVLSVEDGVQDGLKAVQRPLDEEPLLSEWMLRLGAFLRERYFCTYFDAVRVMLPAGLWFRTENFYTLVPDRDWEGENLRQKDAVALLRVLQDCGGEAGDKLLQTVVEGEEAYDKAISYLLRKKLITAQLKVQPKTSDKTEKIATLTASAEETLDYENSLRKAAVMQKNVLSLMRSVGSASVKEICYFTGAKPATVNRLAELGFLELSERPVLRCRQIVPAKIPEKLVLNAEQDSVCRGLMAQMAEKDPGAALLHGVTGSGKTAVYIRLIRNCLDSGKQAILLVPEIALTPQLLGLMAAWFGDQVAVLHSSLPATERYDQWKRIRNKQAGVVVGTRSAVFAPCEDPGLIILDEEQEHSYQSENSPRYSAREVALWRGVKQKALVLMGSATPSVESMYLAKSGAYKLYSLKERYNGKPLPQVEIVDMRDQLEQGNDGMLSYPLQMAMQENLDGGKQTVLFLNRRGNSRALVCVDCREAPECPRCSNRLTYHSANERLMCHYCGYSQPVVKNCPKCGGRLKQIGSGTQKVEQEIHSIFGEIPVERMDADTVSAANPHEKILNRFQEEHIPVLLGTQMVAKGLNFPAVTLVGVLDADLSLYVSSYRAAETTFNMLTQVVGRAGRGDDMGRAIIQTLVPEHKVITLAASQDYAGFYELEIGMRKLQNCPPFADCTVITFTGKNEARVIRGAVKFRDSLAACLGVQILGPAPCAVPKINYTFRYQLTMRCRLDRERRKALAALLKQFSADSENREISAFISVNGYD